MERSKNCQESKYTQYLEVLFIKSMLYVPHYYKNTEIQDTFHI